MLAESAVFLLPRYLFMALSATNNGEVPRTTDSVDVSTFYAWLMMHLCLVVRFGRSFCLYGEGSCSSQQSNMLPEKNRKL